MIKSKSEIDTHRDSRELCAVGAGLQGRWDLSSGVDARGSGHWLAAAHLAAPTAQPGAAVPGSQSEAQKRCGEGGARHGGGAHRRGGGAEGRREHSLGGRAVQSGAAAGACVKTHRLPMEERDIYSSLILSQR